MSIQKSTRLVSPQSGLQTRFTAMLILLLGLMLPGMAMSAEVRAFVDRTNASLGESLQLTVSIRGAGGDVDISPIRDFKVISRGTSSNYEMINGRTSWEMSYNYTLIPLKEGRLLIPPLRVSTDGEIRQTKEIIVEVVKRGGGKAEDRDLFCEANVSNPNPYEGEQFVYTFKFYTAAQIARGANFQKPSFSGFTAKNIEGEKTYQSVVAGRGYTVSELSYILVPMGPGEKIIEPAVLECNVVKSRSRSGSTFDSFFSDPFFGRGSLDPKILRTESLKVNVKPLPPYNGDAKFSGLVGRFDIQAKVENNRLKVGDSTTLSLTVQGTGNIMDAEDPEIKVPQESFKVYRDSPEESIQTGANGYSGKKVFRTAIVPVKAGQYFLEPIRIAYFDVSKGQYETRSTQPVSLMVSPSGEKDKPEVFSAPLPGGTSVKKKVEFTGRDILPLKESLDSLENRRTLAPSRFALFLLTPAFLFLAVKAILIKTRKSDDPARLMAERAEKALKSACSHEASGEEFLSCLYLSLISVIFSKAKTKGESLTYTEAADILRSCGYADDIAKQAAALLEKIESAKFGGVTMNKEFKEKLFSETKEIVRSLSQ